VQEHRRIRPEGRNGAEPLMAEPADRERDDLLRLQPAVARLQFGRLDGDLLVGATLP